MPGRKAHHGVPCHDSFASYGQKIVLHTLCSGFANPRPERSYKGW
jgi:hypothetical protein